MKSRFLILALVAFIIMPVQSLTRTGSSTWSTSAVLAKGDKEKQNHSSKKDKHGHSDKKGKKEHHGKKGQKGQQNHHGKKDPQSHSDKNNKKGHSQKKDKQSHSGKNDKHVQSDIVGGRPTTPGEIPYQVALIDVSMGHSPKAREQCGGSIVASDIVLTAAHCVSGYGESFPQNLKVVVGRTNLNDSNQGVVLGVKRIVVNPYYNLADDSAILLLDGAVDTSIYTPIVLAGPGDEALEEPGKIASVSGWGSIHPYIPGKKHNKHTKYIKELKVTQIPVVSDDTCMSIYPDKKGYRQFVPDKEVCAGKGGTASCWGDSGGPLVVDGKQIGIVNRQSGCAAKDKVSIYASTIGIYDTLQGMISKAGTYRN